MIGFIDDHREAHGVEPICKVLPIAPSTYYDHVARRRDPARLSAREKRDMALKLVNRLSILPPDRRAKLTPSERHGGSCPGSQ